MERRILVNRIICPDGTELVSKHRHDFVQYEQEDGKYYSVDGGQEYLRRGFTANDYTEASLYDDSPFEELRENIYRGGRGKEGDEPLRHVKLSEVSDEWLEAVIVYEAERRPKNIYLPYYRLEQIYRDKNGIEIKE